MTLVQVLADHGLNLLALLVSSNGHICQIKSFEYLLFIVEHDDGVLVLDDLLVKFFQ